VKSYTRPAERESWAERASHAVAYEIAQLTPAVITAAARACEQPEFFGRAVPNVAALAATPIDHALAREVGIARETNARDAIANAVCRAVGHRVDAQIREAHIHLAIEAPRDCGVLMARIRESIAAVPIQALVTRALGGERLPVTRQRSPVDYEEDIRPRP
jgi:hypothetical protein